MRNLKLEIEYDGTNYCGWQVQTREKSRPSIQEIIEKTLRKILQEKIKLIGSGRTDAGVHAQAQVANFKTHSTTTSAKLQRALNGLLPDDIAVTRVEEVPLDFHSRFDVKAKVYRYTILKRSYPSAMLRNRVYFYPYHLDLKLMHKAGNLLLGKHNFKSFQASDKKERDAIRTIKRLKVTKDNDLIYIDIEANGFLYNMVRNIAGTLIEIGRGKSIDIRKLLMAEDRTKAPPTAPAKGLSLLTVRYK